MRDQRDPEALGLVLRNLVQFQKVPVLRAADELGAYAIKDYVSPDCVGRYGRPDEVKEYWERIQIR